MSFFKNQASQRAGWVHLTNQFTSLPTQETLIVAFNKILGEMKIPSYFEPFIMLPNPMIFKLSESSK